MIEKNQYKEMDRFQSAIIVSTNKYYVDHPVKLQITLKKKIFPNYLADKRVPGSAYLCNISSSAVDLLFEGLQGFGHHGRHSCQHTHDTEEHTHCSMALFMQDVFNKQ